MSTWFIKGQLQQLSGEALPYLKVALFRQSKGKSDFVMDTTSDQKGNYQFVIPIGKLNISKTTKSNPTLFFRIYNLQGNFIAEYPCNNATAPDIDQNITIDYKAKPTDHISLPIDVLVDDFLMNTEQKTIINGKTFHTPIEKIKKSQLLSKLREKGIDNSVALLQYFSAQNQLDSMAAAFNLSPNSLIGLLQAATKFNPSQEPANLIIPATGHKALEEIRDASIKAQLKKTQKVNRQQINNWHRHQHSLQKNKGKLEAVDLRPYLGRAKNQGGIGSCTAFCATALVEALENMRDQRGKLINLSEAQAFWNAKKGQLYCDGGYNGLQAIHDYQNIGGCEEIYNPYNTQLIANNYVQLPVSDAAIDRAHLYKNGLGVNLQPRDVDIAKEALRSGRCVALISGVRDWTHASIHNNWVIPMPANPNAFGPEGGHCTAIVGFIDKDGLPSSYEGGYFIVRNSWGGENATNHILGQEYGGHLLMPYGWYRRYSLEAHIIQDNSQDQTNWLAEYYYGTDLKGKNIQQVKLLGRQIEVPKTVEQVDHDWGIYSVFKYSFPNWRPIQNSINILPPFDFFSVRFTQIRSMTEGFYRFQLSGNDGMRLYVDDELVINSWQQQGEVANWAEHYVTSGDHILRVEYFDKTGEANIDLDISPINIQYEYFDNPDVQGAPKQVQHSSQTTLEWRHLPPVDNPHQQGVFSARGTMRKYFAGGIHHFKSLHSGGCRIKVDNQLVYDNWDGQGNAIRQSLITPGYHTVIIEYKHTDLLPISGNRTYYKAFLNFGWANSNWKLEAYKDDNSRLNIVRRQFDEVDSHHQAYRVHALTGSPIHTTYIYQYINKGWRINLQPNSDAFRRMMGATFNNADNLSLRITRQIFIEKEGYYDLSLNADEGHRLCIDGKLWLENHHTLHKGGNWGHQEEVWLRTGIHTISLEYVNTSWETGVDLLIKPAEWDIKYYSDTLLKNEIATAKLNSINDVLSQKPSNVANDMFSIRASRTIYRPIGSYLFHLRGDDGFRLRVNGQLVIDRWKVQGATSYTSSYEHHGGAMFIEVEYFEARGLALLEYEMVPLGYFVEYYKGKELNHSKVSPRPIAYRFEPSLNLNIGLGNVSTRIGSDNFSARWHGRVYLPVGRYRVELESDSGVRLYVNGRLLIEEWNSVKLTTHTKMVDLVGCYHNVHVEYYEGTGVAKCCLKFVRIY